MFQFLAAKTTDERMAELERFIEFWYGPRRPEFGEPLGANEYPELPAVLRRFYSFAGRWPSPKSAEDDYFYAGHGGHHLLSLDLTGTTDDGRLRFFMEYQGDWDGVVEVRHPDPPVWIVGVWEGDEEEDESDDDDDGGDKTRMVSDTLSAFLVTHCLMATVYESENTGFSRYSTPFTDGDKLRRWYDESLGTSELLWEVPPDCCPQYAGRFRLIQEHVLVLDSGGALNACAIHPDGVALLRSVVGAEA